MQPTAPVNEVYLKLFGPSALAPIDKAHFLAVAPQMMRRVLVDHARARHAEKRGGDLQRVDTDELDRFAGPSDVLRFPELDRAPNLLAEESPVLARGIELRYFGGLTAEETAEVTGRSVHSVRHDLRFAQTWLRRALGGDQAT